MSLRIGVDGRILAGLHEGSFVRFRDDAEQTGGYLVLIVNDLVAPTDGADYWVADRAELERFAADAEWRIAWGE
ncbi:hypothetical protein [Actinoplanes utahensis]|uniref:Uncharacterized protein n=1 Tax=Actinoplanes utahensis TaxID=1869 RepID=A0A0A6U7F3_ACTUT|nr:hypothetical protein [Actinoplanes utahensis]KHD71990.1 hypothetical protein MB27_42440 [Actinoplanes utahensis]GIF31678.1 hypothetical protein Aut01nite_46640 [Actinoplanes utahensis]